MTDIIIFGGSFLYIVLLLYTILKNRNGVSQKVKTYGEKYYLTTIVWYKGKKYRKYTDEYTNEEEFLEGKKTHKHFAENIYNELIK